MSDGTADLRPPQRPGHNGPRLRVLRIIVALMLREISTTYGRSAGGYIWAIVEPVLGIVLLSTIFSLMVAHPALGSNFPLFYASGLLPFMMFNDICNKVAGSIRFSRPFLAYPSVTFADSLIARVILNSLTHSTVIGVVIGGIILVFRLPIILDLGAVLQSLLLITFLAVGVGTLNCYLFTAFPVWERVWHILTRPLFLMSGVFFMYGMMPPRAQHMLWYNPLIHCIGLMRKGLYPTYKGDYISPAYAVGVSVVPLIFGLMLLERNYRKLLER